MKNSIERLRILISRLFAVAMIALILVSGSHWQTDVPLLGSVLFCLGAMLAGVASLGRMWCSLYIAGYKTNKLITEGPYSMTRNPLYFFSFLGAVGIGLVTETFFLSLIMLIGFAIYYPLVIKSEEAKLLKLHSADYLAYFNKTPRFFPNLSALAEPEEYEVKPIIYRKHILDAVWFVWILGILEILKGLRALDILPTYFTFY